MLKILLTGSRGMVGKNICGHPCSKEYQILKPPRSDLDLLNAKSVSDYMQAEKPDVVIHAAGLVGGIQANMANPVNFLVNNVQIGINTIMAARSVGVTRLINLGSSCMYPRNAPSPLTENLLVKGELEPTNEGYAIAKITTSRLCEYINREDHTFSYKTAIPCNLYGEFDRFDLETSHLIPAVIRKLSEAKENSAETVKIWGDGSARREFMYAGDLADFIFYAIENFEAMPQNINVGLGTDLSINEYYERIANVVGYQGKFEHDLSRPTGMQQKLIDDTLLKEFGWQYKTSIDDGLAKTYTYYLNEIMKIA